MADELTELPHLPTEIIREILAWLPVKLLCRFKCVSKSWNSITLEPYFVNMHFNKALEHEDVLYQRRRVIVSDLYTDMIYSFNLDELLDRVDTDHNVGDDHEILVTEVDRVGDVTGSTIDYSTGLALFESNRRFSLYNPVTRESKLVPELMTEPYLFGVGCGFDHSTQDYKLVCGICGDRSTTVEVKFSVYSFKIGYWRVIEKGYTCQSENGPLQGLLLNGGIHWSVMLQYTWRALFHPINYFNITNCPSWQP